MNNPSSTPPIARIGPRARSILIAGTAVWLTGCATMFAPPPPYDDAVLRERATAVEDEGIRISAALPSEAETVGIFGVDLGAQRIQPLWLEIRNDTDRELRYLPTGTDPEYFSPLEVAFRYRKQFSKNSRSILNEHFQQMTMRTRIPPKSTRSGFILTNQDIGAKVVNVDLVANKWTQTFTFIVGNPDKVDAAEAWTRLDRRLNSPDVITVSGENELRNALTELPCCTAGPDGQPGTPLNLVLIGDRAGISSATKRRGFHFTQVAPQYVFGRVQDTAGTKQPTWIRAQPDIVRLWLTPIRYKGLPVWIGHVNMPRGGRFGDVFGFDPDRPIDPDIDHARLDFVQDLIYSQYVEKIGFIAGLDAVPRSEPASAFDESKYFTDGLRAVIVLGDSHTALYEIQFFDWERLADYRQALERPNSN